MISLVGLITALAAVVGVTALPSQDSSGVILEARESHLQARQAEAPTPATHVRTPISGPHGGYRYEWWTNTPNYEAPNTAYTLEPDGAISVEWNDDLALTFGLGWHRPYGSRLRDITYSANLSVTTGAAFTGIHGVTINPFVEYYIVDDYTPEFQSWFDRFNNESTMYVSMGEVHTSFGVYDLYLHRTFPMMQEYLQARNWAIRRTTRSEGTIKTKEIFDAWLGSRSFWLGSHLSMLVGVVAWEGSQGSARVKILEDEELEGGTLCWIQ
ncbi:glycoside hydrolase family 11 protein [Sodiomyces alcalophilus JCM 7366]|uniref:glycoside hydrolase family 11 protein n=1 Tax=Sodiomyces alcalophilus JCM 7366 TaxID=591952 RepID=UPI0039B57AAF